MPGSDVGPLFQTILVNQFSRLRDGDRYFYENENLSSDEIHLFDKVDTLTKVIEANTDVTNLQSDAFKFTAAIGGSVSLPPIYFGPGTVSGLVVRSSKSRRYGRRNDDDRYKRSLRVRPAGRHHDRNLSGLDRRADGLCGGLLQSHSDYFRR